MNNIPRQTLRQIVAKYGREICADARRCEGLLNDLCGSYHREINVLVNAIEERIPLDLLAGASSMPPELLLTRLEKRLENQTAMTAEAARWAVESWALALGAATDAEIAETRRKQSAQNASNINRADPVQPKTQPQPSKTAPPINRPPTKIPLPAPPVFFPPNSEPPVQAPPANPQLQPSNPVVVHKSRFGIFRGCLILIFLLAVASVILFLGVPFAFEAMRETQRERNNEPPRFPVR